MFQNSIHLLKQKQIKYSGYSLCKRPPDQLWAGCEEMMNKVELCLSHGWLNEEHLNAAWGEGSQASALQSTTRDYNHLLLDTVFLDCTWS